MNMIATACILITLTAWSAWGNPTPDDAYPDADETMVVTGESPDEHERMKNVYRDSESSGYNYRLQRYDKAFDYLLVAAQQGMKQAQARLSYLYAEGLGVERDAAEAVAWLGVAAHGITHPEITAAWDRMWNGQLHPVHREQLEGKVAKYRRLYSAEANGVECAATAPRVREVHRHALGMASLTSDQKQEMRGLASVVSALEAQRVDYIECRKSAEDSDCDQHKPDIAGFYEMVRQTLAPHQLGELKAWSDGKTRLRCVFAEDKGECALSDATGSSFVAAMCRDVVTSEGFDAAEWDLYWRVTNELNRQGL